MTVFLLKLNFVNVYFWCKNYYLLLKELQVVPARLHALARGAFVHVEWMALLIAPSGAVLLYWSTQTPNYAPAQSSWSSGEVIPAGEAFFPLTVDCDLYIAFLHCASISTADVGSVCYCVLVVPELICGSYGVYNGSSYRFTTWNNEFSSSFILSWKLWLLINDYNWYFSISLSDGHIKEGSSWDEPTENYLLNLQLQRYSLTYFNCPAHISPVLVSPSLHSKHETADWHSLSLWTQQNI